MRFLHLLNQLLEDGFLLLIDVLALVEFGVEGVQVHLFYVIVFTETIDSFLLHVVHLVEGG